MSVHSDYLSSCFDVHFYDTLQQQDDVKSVLFFFCIEKLNVYVKV